MHVNRRIIYQYALICLGIPINLNLEFYSVIIMSILWKSSFLMLWTRSIDSSLIVSGALRQCQLRYYTSGSTFLAPNLVNWWQYDGLVSYHRLLIIDCWLLNIVYKECHGRKSCVQLDLLRSLFITWLSFVLGVF